MAFFKDRSEKNNCCSVTRLSCIVSQRVILFIWTQSQLTFVGFRKLRRGLKPHYSKLSESLRFNGAEPCMGFFKCECRWMKQVHELIHQEQLIVDT